MTRLIFDTLSLLFFGLLLGAWLHARFGKSTVEGGWWDFALGLVILMWYSLGPNRSRARRDFVRHRRSLWPFTNEELVGDALAPLRRAD